MPGEKLARNLNEGASEPPSSEAEKNLGTPKVVYPISNAKRIGITALAWAMFHCGQLHSGLQCSIDALEYVKGLDDSMMDRLNAVIDSEQDTALEIVTIIERLME